MATESYAPSLMADRLNEQNMSSNRLISGQRGDEDGGLSDGRNRTYRSDFRHLQEHRPRSHTAAYQIPAAVEGNHEMDRGRIGERVRYHTGPVASSASVLPYNYEPPIYPPGGNYDGVYKGMRQGENDMMHRPPVSMMHSGAVGGGGRSFYGMPSYMPPMPAHRHPIVNAEQSYNPEAQIAQLRQYASDCQRLSMELSNDLYQARQEIDSLKKQIAEYANTEKDRNDHSKSAKRYWSPEEHQKFLEAIDKYGHKDVRAIANYVGSRNPTQVRTHKQKYFLKLQRKPTAEAASSQGTDEQSALNQRRCMSEGDLFRVQNQQSLKEKDDGDDDSTKEPRNADNELKKEEETHVSSREVSISKSNSSEQITEPLSKRLVDPKKRLRKPPLHPGTKKNGDEKDDG